MKSILQFIFWVIVLIIAGYITLFAIGLLINILAWIILAPMYAVVMLLFFGIAGFISIKIAKWLFKKI